jgi:opacity protein-like surface antigen
MMRLHGTYVELYYYGFMNRIPTAGLALVMLAFASTQARADITAFIGANTTPTNRQVRGAAIGFGLLVVGVELEYAYTPDDLATAAPSLKTGTGNVILQTPVAIMGFQPYFTTGAGIYQEELGAHSDTGFAFDTGGGVKVTLAGPIRLRVDYRLFKLGSGALYSPTHRFYAGLNLKF